MRIDSITLRNFCCFDSRRFDLAPRFTLLIGDNGSGKTSILDGLAVGLGSLFLGFPEGAVPRSIYREEIRFRSLMIGETPTRELQFPVQVQCEGIVDGQSGAWSRELNSLEGRTTRQHAGWIQKRGEEMSQRVREGAEVLLPVISSYGTGRLWVQKRQRAVEALPPGSRSLGYLDCLDPASDEKRLLAWFKTNEIAAIQRQQPIGVLESARTAIRTSINEARHVYFDVSLDDLVLRLGQADLPFYSLSDGYRNLLAMVADIAVRCGTLNPALMDRAATETPGVVLIDEIDLHLHPKWQRHVVEDLLRTFPKVQFVATTHSPFIIQSLLPRPDVKLLNLDNQATADFVNKSVEEIAEEIQGVPEVQRSKRYQDMMKAAQRYFQALQDAQGVAPDQREALRRELDRLSAPYGDDPAYQAFLRMQRLASGIDGGNGDAPR